MIGTRVAIGSLFAALLSGSPAAAVPPAGVQAAVERATGVGSMLEQIRGMRVSSSDRFGGGIVFRLSFRQPVDHRHRGRGSFRQRLVPHLTIAQVAPSGAGHGGWCSAGRVSSVGRRCPQATRG
ncbi:MAG: hypothetical protein M3419_06080 [Actinomycetota bacterium]|nr:hypothetical protein [Actinomycetota bacterium]